MQLSDLPAERTTGDHVRTLHRLATAVAEARHDGSIGKPAANRCARHPPPPAAASPQSRLPTRALRGWPTCLPAPCCASLIVSHWPCCLSCCNLPQPALL